MTEGTHETFITEKDGYQTDVIVDYEYNRGEAENWPHSPGTGDTVDIMSAVDENHRDKFCEMSAADYNRITEEIINKESNL